MISKINAEDIPEYTGDSNGVFLGWKQEDTIIGAVRFSYPEKAEERKYYSTRFEVILNSEKTPNLVDFYIELASPADLFAYQSHETRVFRKWSAGQISGVNTYEWFNPDVTHYVYKITASDSSKYYYGVSHVKKKDATMEDCSNDGYFGSGGNTVKNKFRNWKNKHQKTVMKTVLATFDKKASAYLYEKAIVGDLFRTDPLCLNSIQGGNYADVFRTQNIGAQECAIHGEVAHLGNSCATCTSQKAISMKVCALHGEVKHQGEVCSTCNAASSINFAKCPNHGITKHQGKICSTCNANKSINMKYCDKHGDSKHDNNKCCKCTTEAQLSIAFCEIHREYTKHRGAMCYKCKNSFTQEDVLRQCSIHGNVKHKGKSCYSCEAEKKITFKECPIHGISKFHGESCSKCSIAAIISEQECEIHGQTKFRGKICVKCANAKSWEMLSCKTHGLTKHQAKSCVKCRFSDSTILKECPTHGLSKHRGKNCYKCSSDKRRSLEKT